jgi:alkylation response protein AidB-like acyl-CoA dehydrogenase
MCAPALRSTLASAGDTDGVPSGGGRTAGRRLDARASVRRRLATAASSPEAARSTAARAMPVASSRAVSATCSGSTCGWPATCAASAAALKAEDVF